MVQYKLIYFDRRGQAEMIRCILHYNNIDFEDIRVAQDQWPNFKTSAPFDQVPVLEVDGVKVPQSAAIARFLSRKYGIAGRDELDIAVIDSYSELVKDLQNKTIPYLFVLSGFKEGDKEKLYKEFMDALEQIVPHFERGIASSGTGFISKNGLSWVDFMLANYFLTLKKNTSAEVEKFKTLNEHMKKVHDLPKLKKYFANRKDTAF